MNPEFRFIALSRATGTIRREQRDGRPWTIVPVVALVEGVIRAMNSKEPEYVPLKCLQADPEGWNGVPIHADHPLNEKGEPISGRTPETLKAAFGVVENSRVEGKRLLMDAVIDDAKANTSEKGKDVLSRALEGKPLEVSVGAWVQTAAETGKHGDREYRVAWQSLRHDHLALLTGKKIGACSNAMGCGVLRAAELSDEGFVEVEGEELRAAWNEDQPRDENGRWTSGGGVGLAGHESYQIGSFKDTTFDNAEYATVRVKHDFVLGKGSQRSTASKVKEKKLAAKGWEIDRSITKGNKVTNFRAPKGVSAKDALEAFRTAEGIEFSEDYFRAAMPSGWTDNDVRESLTKAVRAKEVDVSYVYVTAFTDKDVVYQCEYRGADDKWTTSMYKRSYTFDKNTQTFSLGDERKAVEPTIVYEEIPAMKAAGAVQEPVPGEQLKAACGCGGKKPETAASAAGARDMNKEARIAALVANPHNPMKELKALEALSDEGLKVLEDAASKAKSDADALRTAQEAAVKTSADLTELTGKFAALQASAQPLIDAEIAKQAAEKKTLVESLKACTTGILTEEQLNAKPIDELRTLASIAKVTPPTTPQPERNFAAAGMPRFAASANLEQYAPKDSWASLSKS